LLWLKARHVLGASATLQLLLSLAFRAEQHCFIAQVKQFMCTTHVLYSKHGIPRGSQLIRCK